MCQQGHPNYFLGQTSTENIEDLDSVRNKHLMQYQDQFQRPQYADQKGEQLVQTHELARKTLDKGACKLTLEVLQMNLEKEVGLQSPECQPQVPFLKLLSECGEKLGIRDSLNKLTPDISQPQDLQPGTTQAFREYAHC